MMVLPDVLTPGLRVVFCGTAAGTTSAERGAYYAGPGNRFWPILHETGLTPRQLAPEEFTELPQYGIGLTDVSKTHSGMDHQLASDAFDVGGLIKRLDAARPAVVAFNGKGAAQAVLGRPVGYGVQSESIAGAQLHVLPSTSGAARGHWVADYWHELGALVTGIRQGPSG
jgi:double-stranded uracil-DNA glycosylase